MFSATQGLGAPSSSNPASIPDASSPTSTLIGKHVILRPLAISDSPALFESLCGDENASLWTYLPFTGPFTSLEAFTKYVQMLLDNIKANGDFPFVIILPTSKVVGISCLINIAPAHRRLEIGYVIYAKELQRTRAATEAAYLQIKYAFDVLGNERVEWKLNSLNKPSSRAAERYGFKYEGTFRKQ
jgi:RimJ/RimL family protein N-acetyltransferase